MSARPPPLSLRNYQTDAPLPLFVVSHPAEPFFHLWVGFELLVFLEPLAESVVTDLPFLHRLVGLARHLLEVFVRSDNHLRQLELLVGQWTYNSVSNWCISLLVIH